MMIEDELWDELEWDDEDVGIGSYEFWGTREVHTDMQAVLVTPEVEMVGTNITEEDYIPITVTAYGTAWVGDKPYDDMGVIATLSDVTWRESKLYITYDVEVI